jgi:hypothetical protein
LREFRVLLRSVDARGEVRDVEALQFIAARPERLALGRSAARKRFRKPCDDDRSCSDEVVQPICPVIRSLQLEIGRDVARLEFNRASEQRQGMSSISCNSSKAVEAGTATGVNLFCRDLSFSNSADLPDRRFSVLVNGL